MPSLESMAREAERVLAKLAQEATDRASSNKGKRRARQPQSALWERNVAVLYGMHHGWSDPLIGMRFHMSRNTVLRTRRRFGEDPQSIFKIPILHIDISGNRQIYRCEACGRRMGGKGFTERKARTHVADHFINRESMRQHGILDEDRIF